MLKNYLKTALRNLLKHKTFSLLNIFGLSIGIVCAGLILLWVENELTYNANITHKENIQQIELNWNQNNSLRTFTSTPGPLGATALATIPGIVSYCRSTEDQVQALFNFQNKPTYANGKYVDNTFFSIFQCHFLEGNPQTAFSQPNSLVITPRTAEKFFHTKQNVLGKTILVNNATTYTISGLVNDLPDNATVKYEWLAPLENFYPNPQQYLSSWTNCGLETYLQTTPGADLNKINDGLSAIMRSKMPNSINSTVLLNANDWHLRNVFKNGKQTGGTIEFVQLLSIIAGIILLIACINFMNMATARSEQRSKEVGVRKALGAPKGKLVVQFLIESLLQAALAGIIAICIIALVLPAFNALVGKTLLLNLLQPQHLLIFTAIILVSGLLAGSYPALYLSGFQPLAILKGSKVNTAGATFIRKGLVVTQFTISISLIIATIIIYQQIKHAKTRDIGLNMEQLMSITVEKEDVKQFDVIRQDLLNTGVVKSVALADYNPLNGGNNTDEFYWEGKPTTNRTITSIRCINKDFIATAGMKIIDGNNFLAEGTDSTNVIINEAMAKQMGSGSVVGKNLFIGEGKAQMNLRVAGVVKDYVYGDVYGNPDPVVFFNFPSEANRIYLKLLPVNDLESALKKIGTVITTHNPAYPFRYSFTNDQFNAMFNTEIMLQKLSRIFATIAILISCLGLFGLSAYTAERRTREIGIRKVLGASSFGITTMLSVDFLKLILLSILISFPVSWWLMSHWLLRFPYHISIGPMVFIVAGLTALIITMATISFQSIKASIADPAKSLKAE
ncbi:ABC transporter permease [Chitinophaga sp. Cy-1792]|uniref:ABC transporter permease n=1 Tax=Chitinophaga sp. Cy-1792 TaxID=2608339 RepID=UPI00142173E3|nr:ABC transporter permease [Chitinophaga sp. Cy-1792]NIG54367.1 FtsX-like permease family protein [Chitinophaga sp. Cy-1792]